MPAGMPGGASPHFSESAGTATCAPAGAWALVRVEDVFGHFPRAVRLLFPRGDVLTLLDDAAHAHLIRSCGVSKVAAGAHLAFVRHPRERKSRGAAHFLVRLSNRLAAGDDRHPRRIDGGILGKKSHELVGLLRSLGQWRVGCNQAARASSTLKVGAQASPRRARRVP